MVSGAVRKLKATTSSFPTSTLASLTAGIHDCVVWSSPTELVPVFRRVSVPSSSQIQTSSVLHSAPTMSSTLSALRRLITSTEHLLRSHVIERRRRHFVYKALSTLSQKSETRTSLTFVRQSHFLRQIVALFCDSVDRL